MKTYVISMKGKYSTLVILCSLSENPESTIINLRYKTRRVHFITEITLVKVKLYESYKHGLHVG